MSTTGIILVVIYSDYFAIPAHFQPPLILLIYQRMNLYDASSNFSQIRQNCQ